MLGVPPFDGRWVNEFPWGIQIQPYWLVKTHCPAGAACCTTTSSPVVMSTVVGGGGTHVGAGSLGSTPCGVVSATGMPGERSSAADSTTADRKVFMASPRELDAPKRAFLHSTLIPGADPLRPDMAEAPGSTAENAYRFTWITFAGGKPLKEVDDAWL
jgi:hypothetical protein